MQRYSKAVSCMVLEDENDELVGAYYCDGDSTLILASKMGRGIHYHESTVSLIGVKTQGVKALSMDEKDSISDFVVINKSQKGSILLVTEQGGYRIFNPNMLPVTSRTGSPSELYKFYRSEPHYVRHMCFMYDNSKYAILSSTRGAIEIVFDATRATPLGKGIKVTLVDQNETIHWLSDYKVPLVSKDCKVYKPAEKPSQNKIKVEDDIDRITIFDYIDKV